MDRLAFGGLGLAVERGLCEIALRQGTALDRAEGRMLLLDVLERIFHFFVGDTDRRLLGPQIFVAFHLNVGHDFKRSLESQRFAIMHVKIGDLRL